MAAGERRRPTSTVALLILVAAAVVAASALGVRCGGDAAGGPPSGEVEAREPGGAVPAPAAPEAPVARRPPPARDVPDPELERGVRAIVEAAVDCAREHSGGRANASNTRVAVHVRDRATGRVAVALDDRRPLRPASSLKLATTAAALVLLGSGWEFTTRVESEAPPVAGTLAGDLVVRAGGDPLYPPDHGGRAGERLAELAGALADAGVERVAGDLVLDPDPFPDPAPAPEWPDASQHWKDYCALAAGLTANAGILVATVDPTRPGHPARIDVRPASHGLGRRYDAVTVAESVYDLRVGATRTRVTVSGELGRSLGPRRASFAHPDPVGLFGSVLRAELERAGIELGGGVRVERGAPGGVVLADLRTPLLETLGPINADSVNSVADQVFLTLGREAEGDATRAGGERAVRRALAELGADAGGLVQVDGSGLSRADRISARQLASLLAGVLALEPETRRAFVGSLAVAGESGTLADRMEDSPARGRVLAKSGWIAGTSSLSGLALAGADGAGEREWIFAILVEYPASAGGLNTRCFKPMHDAVAELLVAGERP